MEWTTRVLIACVRTFSIRFRHSRGGPGLNDRVGHELWTLIQYINSTNRFLSLYRVDDSGIKLLLEHVITVASSSFLLDKNYSSPPTYRCSTDYWTG